MERSSHGLLKALQDSINKHSSERSTGRNEHSKRLRDNITRYSEEVERIKEKKADDLATLVSNLADQTLKKQSDMEAQIASLTDTMTCTHRDTKSFLSDLAKHMVDDVNIIQNTRIRELEARVDELKAAMEVKDVAMEELNERYHKLVAELDNDNIETTFSKPSRAASVHARVALDHLYKTCKPPRKRQK